MKSSGRNAKDDYNKQRINGAVFVDIDELSDHNTDIPHMLPSKDQFSEHIGKVSHIVSVVLVWQKWLVLVIAIVCLVS